MLDSRLSLEDGIAFRAESFGGIVYDRVRLRRLAVNHLGLQVLELAAGNPDCEAILNGLRNRYPRVDPQTLWLDFQRFGSELAHARMLTQDSARDFPVAAEKRSFETDHERHQATPFWPPNEHLRGPLIVEVAVLFSCNLLCTHCYTSSTSEHKPGLSRAELNDIFGDSAEAGVFDICLTGGEALLRPDIIELIRDAKQWPLFVNLNSNGTPVTQRRAAALRDVGLDQARVSIDSAIPEVHDRFRGRPGALKATRRGVERLVAAGIPVQIHATLSSEAGHNIDDVEQLITLSREMGAAHISFGAVRNVGRATDQSLKVSERELDEAVEHIVTRMETDRFICGVPHTGRRKVPELPGYDGCGNCFNSFSTYIAYDGTVYPCTVTYKRQFMVGSVRGTSVVDIWRGSPKLAELRSVATRSTAASHER